MYLNPNHMTLAERRRIAAWLKANGCRDMIAEHPIIVRGNVAHYQAACRRDRFPADIRVRRIGPEPHDVEIITTPRRIRLRIPLHRIP